MIYKWCMNKPDYNVVALFEIAFSEGIPSVGV